MKHTVKIAIIVATLMAGLSGCGSTGKVKSTYQGSPAEKKIAQRAEQRWNLLSSGQYDKAWEYFTPGHKRFESKESFDLRMRQKRVDWKGAKVLEVNCDESESSCDVVVKVDYVYHSPKPMMGDVSASTELEEKWIKLKNQWYYVDPGLKQKLLK
jgi:uncharacterized protein YchJ